VNIFEALWIDVQNLFRATAHNVTTTAKDFGIPIVPVKSYDELPDPPSPEPETITSLDALPADHRAKFEVLEAQLSMALAAVGFGLRRLETLRTQERQSWLYGIGRDYKAPGRTGIVTDQPNARGPHVEARAADYDYPKLRAESVPSDRDAALASVADANSDVFTWGGNFHLTSGETDPAHWEIKREAA
jgi:hypothetical protein